MATAPPLHTHLQNGADERHRRGQVLEHEIRVHPHHAITEPRQLAIADLVRARPAPMVRAIYFDDKPDGGSREVRDEVPADGHLAAKRDGDALQAAGMQWLAAPLTTDDMAACGLRVVKVVVPQAVGFVLHPDQVVRDHARLQLAWPGAAAGSWNDGPHPVLNAAQLEETWRLERHARRHAPVSTRAHSHE
jgi:hypothetical protein